MYYTVLDSLQGYYSRLMSRLTAARPIDVSILYISHRNCGTFYCKTTTGIINVIEQSNDVFQIAANLLLESMLSTPVDWEVSSV